MQLLRIRQREAKKRQSLPPQEGSYRRKPNPVKRYAGDVLAPVSGEPPSLLPRSDHGALLPCQRLNSSAGIHVILGCHALPQSQLDLGRGEAQAVCKG